MYKVGMRAVGSNENKRNWIIVGIITLLIFAVYAWPWYSFVSPTLAGIPFFYWWVIVWYVISSIILYSIVSLRVKGGAS
jgi:uncharacterized integral membrane protein